MIRKKKPKKTLKKRVIPWFQKSVKYKEKFLKI